MIEDPINLDDEVEEREPEPQVEVPTPEVEVETPPEVEVDPKSVAFHCEQWAGVRLHGTSIHFTDHRYSTSDPGEIERLDQWEHAERVTD